MNLVSLFHRFLGPPPPRSPLPPPAESAEPVDRYWGPRVDELIRSHRFAVEAPGESGTEEGGCRVRTVAAGAHAGVALDAETSLWTGWITLEIDDPTSSPGGEAVQRFLAGAAAWGPLHPGFRMPTVRLDGESQEVTVADLLRRHLSSVLPEHARSSVHRTAFDRRLCVFGLVESAPPASAEALRAWADVDPPTGMESSTAWAERWVRGRVYDRWSSAGTAFVFSHHAGICFSARPPSWMTELFRPRPPGLERPAAGAYFDLALVAFTEAALIACRGARLHDVAARAREAAAGRALGHLRDAFTSPADQGRALLATWRRAIDRDLRDGDGASEA